MSLRPNTINYSESALLMHPCPDHPITHVAALPPSTLDGVEPEGRRGAWTSESSEKFAFSSLSFHVIGPEIIKMTRTTKGSCLTVCGANNGCAFNATFDDSKLTASLYAKAEKSTQHDCKERIPRKDICPGSVPLASKP